MTELTDLELLEVSLVDAGDDPLAKVALFKQKDKEMAEEINEAEDTEKGVHVEISVKTPEEELAEEKLEMQMEQQQQGQMDNTNKATRKSYKAEAESLASANEALVEETDMLKAKVETLEKALEDAKAIEKKAPEEEMLNIDGDMIAKSAIPAPILKKLEEVEKAQEKAALEKKVAELIPNAKGSDEVKAKIIKSLDLSDEGIMEFIRSLDAAFEGAYDEVGKGKAHEFESAQEELDSMIAKYADENSVTVAKATTAVTKTTEGKELYKKAMKENK